MAMRVWMETEGGISDRRLWEEDDNDKHIINDDRLLHVDQETIAVITYISKTWSKETRVLMMIRIVFCRKTHESVVPRDALTATNLFVVSPPFLPMSLSRAHKPSVRWIVFLSSRLCARSLARHRQTLVSLVHPTINQR